MLTSTDTGIARRSAFLLVIRGGIRGRRCFVQASNGVRQFRVLGRRRRFRGFEPRHGVGERRVGILLGCRGGVPRDLGLFINLGKVVSHGLIEGSALGRFKSLRRQDGFLLRRSSGGVRRFVGLACGVGFRVSVSVACVGQFELRRRARGFLPFAAKGRDRLFYSLDGRRDFGRGLDLELLGVFVWIDQRRTGGAARRMRRVEGGRRCVGLRLNQHLRGRQQWVREFGRRHLLRRNDDALADLGQSPKLDGEPGGKPDTAVRSRMAGHDSKMHGDARPRDTLHERHGGGGVNIRAVESFAADDGEDAPWRQVAGHAG